MDVLLRLRRNAAKLLQFAGGLLRGAGNGRLSCGRSNTEEMADGTLVGMTLYSIRFCGPIGIDFKPTAEDRTFLERVEKHRAFTCAPAKQSVATRTYQHALCLHEAFAELPLRGCRALIERSAYGWSFQKYSKAAGCIPDRHLLK